MSYTATVIKELDGKAVVISPKPNGQDSRNVLKHLEAWAIKEQPAIVHFNCGIHDTKKFKTTGKFQVSPEEYEANLRKIVERIRDKTDASVIFATSTPIIDDRAAKVRAERDYELLNESIEQYNAIAEKVMKELNVPVNDLNAKLNDPKAPETTATLIVADGVHLTPAGQQILRSTSCPDDRRSLESEVEMKAFRLFHITDACQFCWCSTSLPNRSSGDDSSDTRRNHRTHLGPSRPLGIHRYHPL